MLGKYQLMRAICEDFDSLKGTPIDDWTKTVVTKLCEIGRDFDFEVGSNT